MAVPAFAADRDLHKRRELRRMQAMATGLLAAIREPRWPSSMREALGSWPELAQLAHVAPQKVREAAFQYETLEGDELLMLEAGLKHVKSIFPVIGRHLNALQGDFSSPA